MAVKETKFLWGIWSNIFWTSDFLLAGVKSKRKRSFWNDAKFTEWL